jgi:hypothetical protein
VHPDRNIVLGQEAGGVEAKIASDVTDSISGFPGVIYCQDDALGARPGRDWLSRRRTYLDLLLRRIG